MTDRNDHDDALLNAAFSAARAEARQPPSADLMARVLADAERSVPRSVAARSVVSPARRRSGWREFIALIGGWPALGGLATAAATGFWIGFAPPATFEGLDEQLFGPAAALTGALPSYDLAEFGEG